MHKLRLYTQYYWQIAAIIDMLPISNFKGALMNYKIMYALLLVSMYTLTGTVSVEQIPPQTEQKVSFDQELYDWSWIFAQVCGCVKQKHYQPDHIGQSMIDAMNSFLTGIDPHSSFLDPKTYKTLLESISGEFFGIGIIIDNTRKANDKSLLIINTIPQGPADKVGIKERDRIVEIDGTSLDGMSTEEAMAKLKGERHTVVSLKVMREGENDLLSFDITRDVIKEQNSLCFYLPEQDIYYLSLSIFTDTALKQIESLLRTAASKKYKGLILDLRNNSGGLLSSVVDIAGLFIPKGSIVVTTKDKQGNTLEKYITTREPILTNKDLVITILVNNYTASAAEILTGCLKLYAEKNIETGSNLSLVFVVGEPTYGKGSVQEIISIGKNCAIKITTSIYALLGDVLIQAEGIKPDFEIERTLPPTEQMEWIKKHYGSERTLTNHITQSKTTVEKTKNKKINTSKQQKTWADRAKKNLLKDNQFRYAINSINLINFMRSCCPDKTKNRTDIIKLVNSIDVGDKKIVLQEIK